MRKKRSLLFYLSIVLVFCVAFYQIIQFGDKLQQITKVPSSPAPGTFKGSIGFFANSLYENLTHPLGLLLLQVIVIIIFARLFGYVFSKIKQPSVIGEMAAGIVLGPSVMGLIFPGISQFLFPATSLANLNFLSQVGLILFMFIIGMELNVKAVIKQAYEAVIISHASIIIPYTLGMCLACYLYQEFAPANISFLSFALFMGIAMSITAFPVLARILQEKGMTKTKLGSMVLTCAAADDVSAWFILAGVIAIVKAGSALSALFSIILAVVYVLIMIVAARPVLRKLGIIYVKEPARRKQVTAFIFLIVLLSSYTTEVIGIHVLFGAFFCGVVMPSSTSFRKIMSDKIEDVSMVLLLPLFFAFTGLRTQITLLNDTHVWSICGLIILVAVLGKFGGSALAAKVTGQDWKESLSTGALMNTRGLMELIVLNIGYDLGILSPQIFAMMVLMALITTFTTGPALDLINRWMPEKSTAG